ncbi:fibrillin-2-like [Sycon ciliatum]|uniref:fibrillin-2-like n=1 Tax=Sycon ciliatum TaxID=27933 RepID=UPI0031F70C4B
MLGFGLDAQGKCAQNVCGAFKGHPYTVYTRVSNVAKNVSCLPGFRLASGKPSTIYCDGTDWTLSFCRDIDECRVQPLPCELSRCVNELGTYQCCPLGYRRNISLPTRCGENSCPPPAPIPNAVTTGNSTVEKNVSCLPGYTLATGSPPVIYCQTNQKWTFSACEENSCPPPAPIPNAVTTGNSTVEKNVSCLSGYTLAPGSAPVIYCQTNQKWTFSACEDLKSPGRLNSTNLVAPIAGSIAAAVIVLIVVAFVVLRRRSRRSGSAQLRKPFTPLTGMLSTSMLLSNAMSPTQNERSSATSDTRTIVERPPCQETACSPTSECASGYASKNARDRGPSCGDDESSSETSKYASKAAQEKKSCKEEEYFDETNRYASLKLIRKEYSC